MKKQLLIAAVAATMTSAAMADISISGSANIKMDAAELSTGGTTEGSSMNMDIDFAAKNGGTAVYAHLDIDDAGQVNGDTDGTTGDKNGKINVDKLYMTTSIGSVNIKSVLMESVSVNRFRDNLKNFVEQSINEHVPIKVTRRNGEDFVVLSADDWEREQETLYILQNNELMKQIAVSTVSHASNEGYAPNTGELNEIIGV
jgi:antitoxin YefM